MTRLGLLLTLTEPPPAMEEELNAWYDEEHLAERLAIPGVRSATRWVADVFPRQLGAADLHPGTNALLLNSEVRNALQIRRFASEDGERITLCELPDPQGVPGIVYRRCQP